MVNSFEKIFWAADHNFAALWSQHNEDVGELAGLTEYPPETTAAITFPVSQ
jgi:hypothetical protein